MSTISAREHPDRHDENDADTSRDGVPPRGIETAGGTAPEHSDDVAPRDLVERAERLSRRNSFRIGLTVGVVVTVAAALLIIQNGASTRLNWGFWSFNAPLWIFLALTLLAGMVLGRVIPFAIRRGRLRARRRREALAQAREALSPHEA
jgi:uncharacterized integral membrane protein